jgi:hypothetical protein
MIFITLEDLQPYIKNNVLADIIQTPYTIIVASGSTLLDSIEGISISKIKAYTGHYYDIDSQLTDIGINRDALLISLIIDLMLYEMDARLTPTQIPEIRTKRYNAVIKSLEDIRAGMTPTSWRILQKDVEESSAYRFGSAPPFTMYY